MVPSGRSAGVLSERFDEALVLASSLHRRQVRKGSGVPYVSHLLAVCGIVLEHGGSETEAIAALLHDGPEDQGGYETLETIRVRFGDAVADIVRDCSDTFTKPKPPWLDRKQRYIDHLDSDGTSRSVLMVSAADKLHNLQSTLDDLSRDGAPVWDRFSSTPEQQHWYYSSLSDIYQRRLPGPLADAVAQRVGALGDAVFGAPGAHGDPRATGRGPERDQRPG
jgi:(p)ppGpp synthase/HD superfamily hydrolase